MKKRADGRYQATFVTGKDENGKEKRKVVYGHTKQELANNLAEAKVLFNKGYDVNLKDVYMRDYAKTWLKFKISDLKAKSNNESFYTLDMYDRIIHNHIIPDLGHFKLRSIKQHHIQDLIAEKRSNGLTRTVEIYIMTLKEIIKKAVGDEYLYKNPMDLIKNSKSGCAKKRSLTQNEIDIINKAELSLKERTFLLALLYTGMRPGEILGLIKSDYKEDDNLIDINKVIVFSPNEPKPKPMTKTISGMRRIPLFEGLRATFEEYYKEVNTIPIFPSAGGSYMSKSAFRKFWGKILTKLNVAAKGNENLTAIPNDFTPYIFRHTFATLLYYSDIDMLEAQRYMGHKSVNIMLEIYTHLKEKTGNELTVSLQLESSKNNTSAVKA